MGRYIIRRLLTAIPVLLGISVLTFSIVHMMPGDPVDLLTFGAAIDEAGKDRIRHSLGLDLPVHEQYWRFITGAVRGDLGNSIFTRNPVMDRIAEELPSTIELTIAGMAVTLIIGFAFGIGAALKPHSWLDTIFMTSSFLGLSIPQFWLGLVLLFIFAVQLKWVPAIGSGGLDRLILPAIALGWSFAAIISRLVRQSLLDVMRTEYVLVARAKGLRERLVLWRHALKNALIPVVTIAGLQIGNMIGGAVVVEYVFARQGIGRMALRAILDKDYPMIQGVVLLTAVIYVVINVVVDISYAWLDPRIRYE